MHHGKAKAGSAEQLMRSRYSAYFFRLVDYLVETTHPDTRQPGLRRELEKTVHQVNWAGLEVLQVLEGMRLVALTWMPIQVTQSVIPIGGALFIVCELISLPHYWRMTASGTSLEHAEIEQEVEHELKQAGER